MAQKNTNLHQAKVNKNDEFYTTLQTVEEEMKYYKDYFRGKVVYCNCDDPKWSNFFRFFSKKFEDYGLKKLISTCYNENGHGSVLIYEGDKNGNRIVDDSEIKVQELNGNGDFRSDECIELLKQADIVVTNPPFSLFRQYVAQLVEYNKKFIIIGNKNAITYKEIFPLIKENKLWLGINSPRDFKLPNGEMTKTVSGLCRWFTNLENKKRNRELCLWKKYNPKDFPKYDNYDAINVDKVIEIPEDYDGVMGVPITFLDKYCPKQFTIIGLACGNTRASYSKEFLDSVGYVPNINDRGGCGVINGQRVYARILIQKIKKSV